MKTLVVEDSGVYTGLTKDFDHYNIVEVIDVSDIGDQG